MVHKINSGSLFGAKFYFPFSRKAYFAVTHGSFYDSQFSPSYGSSHTIFTGAKLKGAKLPEGYILSNDGIPVSVNAFNNPINSVNNQGIPFYPESPIYTWEGLRFRSQTEVKIAQALERRGVIFWANCVARLNNPQKANLRCNKEADFMVCWQGNFGILEVDGPHHTPATASEEQERDRLFRHYGIKVTEHFSASRCDREPEKVVDEFLKLIEKMY